MHKLDYSALRARKVAAADYGYAREAATAPGYRFYDPLVGSFSSRSLRGYFDALQDRLSSGGILCVLQTIRKTSSGDTNDKRKTRTVRRLR